MGGLLLAFMVECGVITYRDLLGSPQAKAGHTLIGLPLPSEYLSAVAIFGGLGMLGRASPGAQTTAALVGWGLVVATLLNLGVPGVPKTTMTQPSTSTASSKQGAKV